MTYCNCANSHKAGCPNDKPGGLPPLRIEDGMRNDTYGEITPDELADLRRHAQKCSTCGMVATIDPAFHASRYAHAPTLATPDGPRRWDIRRHGWVETAR